MDAQSQQTLARLIRTQRIAALGTLRDGGPLVSMILYAVAPDFSAFYIHASRLAQHTRDILQDARVSLMIAETDTGVPDPQTLARVSIRGEAVEVPPADPDYAEARSLYLTKFPQAVFNFDLGDFALYRIQPRRARFVAGFGQIFNLTLADFKQTAAPGLDEGD
jgi:putative heme iron utilization protein